MIPQATGIIAQSETRVFEDAVIQGRLHVELLPQREIRNSRLERFHKLLDQGRTVLFRGVATQAAINQFQSADFRFPDGEMAQPEGQFSAFAQANENSLRAPIPG